MKQASDQNIKHLPVQNQLGEEPLWCPKQQKLYWVDTIPPAKIFSYSPASETIQSHALPEPAYSLALDADDSLLVATAHHIRQWNEQEGLGEVLADIELDHPQNRINCMAADPAGNLWIGTMQNNVASDGSQIEITGYFGALYRLDPKGELRQFADGFACPNTMLWSPDMRAFYFGDSATGWIYRYEYHAQSGEIGTRENFFHSEQYGLPDGSAMDAEGVIWNARWGAACLLGVQEDGTVVEKIELTATQPTCCVFGGADQQTLYVTSARYGLAKDQLANTDGDLFIVAGNTPGSGIYRYGKNKGASR